MKMRGVKRRLPGLLLGVADDRSSLELRVLRLMDRRVLWTGSRRVVGTGASLVAMAILSVGVAAAVRVMPFAAEAQLLHATGPLPRFEVATIKPGRDDDKMFFDLKGPAVISMHSFSVKDLLQMAYGIRSDNQLAGVSGWMTTQRFDIEAKLSEAEVATEQKLQMQEKNERWSLMMQALLADRFQLKTSETSKEVSVYELVVTKGGPKLKPSAVDEDPAKPKRSPLQGRPGKLEGAAVPVSTLAGVLGRQSELGGGSFLTGGGMVIDKTGLTGVYDWTLTWTPVNAAATDALPDPNAPGLFTALEEQLGLKLTAAKAPVQVLVVEHIERPTEN